MSLSALNNIIYLDHNATMPMLPSVKSKMDEYALLPLNASSIHAFGRNAKSLIEAARRQLATLVGIADYFRDFQITFTSGATEANAIILANYKEGEIFISATEHPSVWAHSGFDSNYTIINVDNNGILDLNDLEQKLNNSKSSKKLVSVMLANNETGVISRLQQIAIIAHKHGAEIHSDCAQGIGKMPVDIIALDLDYASVSGHKFGGPVGVGALISKAKCLFRPIFLGGGQERGMRSGTENVLAIAGMGQAALIALQELDARSENMKNLQSALESKLMKEFEDIKIAGIKSDRLPNTSLIINPRVKAQIMLIALDLKGITVSSGAACSSGRVGKSHVLSAMGYSDNDVESAIRISVGYNTSAQDIDNFLGIYSELNK